MERSIGVFETKTNLSAILEEVARGATFTITRHDRPIARLVPIQGQTERAESKTDVATVAEIQRWLAGG